MRSTRLAGHALDRHSQWKTYAAHLWIANQILGAARFCRFQIFAAWRSRFHCASDCKSFLWGVWPELKPKNVLQDWTIVKLILACAWNAEFRSRCLKISPVSKLAASETSLIIKWTSHDHIWPITAAKLMEHQPIRWLWREIPKLDAKTKVCTLLRSKT